MDKVVEKIKSEPVRVRLYTLAALVALYLAGRGYISPTDADFIISVVGVVLAVETARAKVSPVAKRSE